jgi:cytochrome P450
MIARMAPPPGPSLPGFVELARWMAGPVASFEKGFREYGDIYGVNNPMFGREVIVSHPDLIKQMFTGDPDLYHGGESNAFLAPVLGQSSVLLLDGARHRRERKLLVPPFHGERLGVYADVMRALTEREVDDLVVGEAFSMLPHMQRLTFDVILHTVFGVTEGAVIDELRVRLLTMMEKAQSPMGLLYTMPWFQKDLGPLTGWASFKRSIEAADAAIYAVLAAARAAPANGAPRTDVLSMLLAAVDDEGQPMTDVELRDELVTLLVAGHETSAIALSWAVEEIVRHPEVLARVLAEIAAAPAGTEHRAPLPYLDATIKEVLRLHPLVSMVSRRTTAPTTMREYEIPAGTYLLGCVYNMQRHPDFWEEPAAFKPERFLDKKPDPYAWLPFGGGARRCIGMAFALLEMRVVLATLLPRVVMRLPKGPAKVALRSLLFAPQGGTRVVVEERRETMLRGRERDRSRSEQVG